MIVWHKKCWFLSTFLFSEKRYTRQHQHKLVHSFPLAQWHCYYISESTGRSELGLSSFLNLFAKYVITVSIAEEPETTSTF